MNLPHPSAIAGRILLSVMFLLFAGCSRPEGYVVTVENRSGQPIEEFLLKVPGDTIPFGILQPSDNETERFHIKKNGVIKYRFQSDGKCYSGLVDGSVANMQGGRKTIAIGKHGQTEILDDIHRTRVKSTPDKPSPQQEWALPCMLPG